MVESPLTIWSAGSERTEDLDQFRRDKALALLLGCHLMAAQTARDFLAQFHAEDLPLLQQGKTPVACETVPLLGLAKLNAELVLDLECRRPVKGGNPRRHCDPLQQARGQTLITGSRGYHGFGAVGRTGHHRCCSATAICRRGRATAGRSRRRSRR
jgi:hypothetical protein